MPGELDKYNDPNPNKFKSLKKRVDAMTKEKKETRNEVIYEVVQWFNKEIKELNQSTNYDSLRERELKNHGDSLWMLISPDFDEFFF